MNVISAIIAGFVAAIAIGVYLTIANADTDEEIPQYYGNQDKRCVHLGGTNQPTYKGR